MNTNSHRPVKGLVPSERKVTRLNQRTIPHTTNKSQRSVPVSSPVAELLS